MKNFVIMLLAGLLLASCKVQAPQGNAEVIPPKASPGELMLIQNLNAKSEKGLEVLFDKTGAAVVGTLDSNGLKVLAPNIPAGKVKLRVLDGGREIFTTEVEILATQALQMVMQMDASGKISTLSKMPYSGGFDQGFAQASRQLSYDILNEKGQVLFSASVAYPATERKEVFEKPEGDNIRNTNEKVQNVVFPLKIPNMEGATMIRLYDSGGDDLSQSAARAKRKLIQEISIR